MNSLLLPPSIFLTPPHSRGPPSFLPLKPHPTTHSHHSHSKTPLSFRSSIHASIPSNKGVVSTINFEDFLEKDWSFLDTDDSNSVDEHNQKTNRIISAGEIEETSRVLISIGSEEFVDRVFDSSKSKLLLVVHDSLFVLAGIKEKYDDVKCWQGELIYVPEKWAPFDVVFLYFLPALPFELGEVFRVLSKYCSPGARIVISHPEGREVLVQQRKQYPDVVVSDLPDKAALEKVATDHSFEVTEFVDETRFYLAILKFSRS